MCHFNIPYGKSTLIIISLICSLTVNSALCQDRLNDSVQAILKNSKTAGAQVAVLQGWKLIYTLNYGYADIGQNKKVSDSTAFGIMSLSKNMVACAAMQLVNKKLIGLDEPVKRYLKDLPTAYNMVKISQLLNHSSGVPDYVHVPGYMQRANQSQTPMDLIKPIIGNPLDFSPGTKNSYSNSNYILLGLVIEKVSQKKLGDYLENEIFGPVGMTHTYLEYKLPARLDKANGYTLQNDKLTVQPPLDPSQYWAAGGIVSTAHDLVIYDRALKNGQLLPVAEVNRMMSVQKLDNGVNSEYGLGFELMQTPEMEIAGNTGVGLGYNAACLDFLKDSLTVIVLTNTSNDKSGLIAKEIHDLIAPHPSEKKPSSHDHLDEVVLSVIKSSIKGSPDPSNFKSVEALQKFNENALPYIQQQGDLLGVEQKGEKINSETVVRRYQISFKKNTTMWVIIFSGDGKIVMANHM